MNWAMALTVGAVCAAGSAVADVTSDRAAAILHWPDVVVDTDTWDDTLIQLSNTSDDPAYLHCFYINANSHCENTGEVCVDSDECCVDSFCGSCVPGWNETDFHIRLTPKQPIGWMASEGLVDFPIDGIDRQGIGGTSNAGSRIPPAPEQPFDGALKCIVVDDTGTPIDRNIVKGEATKMYYDGEETPSSYDSAKYNAVGVLAIEGAVNDDRELILGGEGAEYNGCPNVIILNHFFDLARNPVVPEDSEDGASAIMTELVLTPCTQNLLRQEPGSSVVQYLVYNEFEQRFSTSRTVNCKQAMYLSNIDTTQNDRSIFSVGVSGTIVGQTRLSPLGDGLIAEAQEYHFWPETSPEGAESRTAAFNVHYQGDRAESDVITLP
jgi:hypothetical protein